MIRLPALVLTAGLGTRLLPLTATRAKPAAPVAGVPLVERILRWLAAQGVTDVVLNLHHHPATISGVVGDGAHLGLRARYSWEQPRILGSGGGPRRALPLLASDRFLIVNGDTLTDVPLDGLIAAHERAGARVTLAVIPNREPDRYGGVLVSGGGAVTGFTHRGAAEASWHFIGLQVAEADAFSGLEDGVTADSIGDVFRTLMSRQPGALRAWRTDGDFTDIGTPADYLRANIRFAQAEGQSWPLVGRRGSIAPSAAVTGCVLWDDVAIEADARLDRCVIADGARVPRGARFVAQALAPAAAWVGPLPVGLRRAAGLIVAPLDPHLALQP